MEDNDIREMRFFLRRIFNQKAECLEKRTDDPEMVIRDRLSAIGIEETREDINEGIEQIIAGFSSLEMVHFRIWYEIINSPGVYRLSAKEIGEKLEITAEEVIQREKEMEEAFILIDDEETQEMLLFFTAILEEW